MTIIEQTHISLLIKLAKIDQELHESERQIITKIAKSYNIEDAVLMNMFKNKNNFISVGSLPKPKKITLIIDTIKIMLADQKIHRREVSFCEMLADNLGFKKSLIDVLIPHFKENMSEQEAKRIITEHEIY